MTVTGTDVSNLVQAVALLLTAISGITSVIVGMRNSSQIKQVHDTTNSKMDAMLEMATKAARAEGKEEGRVERVITDAASAKLASAQSVAFDQGKNEAVVAANVEGNLAEKRIAVATEELVIKEDKK